MQIELRKRVPIMKDTRIGTQSDRERAKDTANQRKDRRQAGLKVSRKMGVFAFAF